MDVGGFIRKQGSKVCADDIWTLDTPREIVANTDGVSSSLVGDVYLATASTIMFLCLVGPVPPRGKFVICVKFNPGFNPFQNFHDRPHTSFPPLVYIEGLPGSLGDNHRCDGCSHNNDYDVEGI